MIKCYRDWKPTPNDNPGLGLDDQQDWLVAPVICTRDSEALEESNIRVALAGLGGESETVEVHRFGHWGPGWYEIILTDPQHRPALEQLVVQLTEYPVLDEEDWSALELERHDEGQCDQHCSFSHADNIE